MTSSEIREYILNNFPKLQASYAKYAAINLVIKSKVGKLVALLFNRMQKRLWQYWLEDVAAGRPIRWFVVKSRQQGSTTWFLGLILWLVTLWQNKSALLLAHDEPAAKALGVKFQYLYARSRAELKPKYRTMNRQQIHFATTLDEMEKTGEIGLDSIVDVMTGDSDGIGRSRTYQYVLITEFSKMDEIGIDIPKMMAAVAQCVEKSPDTAVLIENTVLNNAIGESAAKDFWEDEANGYRKIFIPWVADDSYRLDIPFGIYPELSPDPNSQYGNEIDEFEAIKEALIEWYPQYSNNLNSVELNHEAHCRIAWRRDVLDTQFFDIDYADRRVKFKQEYPTTVYDAFSVGVKSIYSVKRLLEREDFLTREGVVPERFEYDPRRDGFEYTKYGTLRVYEEPVEDARYAIGADAAQGIDGGDDSTLIVLKLPSLIEVASLNDIIPPTKFANMAAALGRLYNNALLAVELNDKGGYAAIQHLEDVVRYPNLYFMEGQNPANIKYGWVSNGVTKSIMISDSKQLVADNGVVINSKEVLKQLKTYVDLGNGKFGGLPGKPDDLVSGLQIAIQCAKAVHVPRPASKPKKAPKGSPDYLIAQMNHRQAVRDRFKRYG